MGFHLTISRRASNVEKVVGCTKIELERQVPVSGQFGLCRLGICGLNITLRNRLKHCLTRTEPLDLFLHSFSSFGGGWAQSPAAGPIKVAAQA